jgi:hypothetical protein
MLKRFLFSFDAIYHDIRSIHDDKMFTQGVRDQVSKFYSILFDKNFMYSCYFVYDILEILAKVSKQFQDSKAVFSDILKILDDLVAELTNLITHDGNHLKEFYHLLCLEREDGMDENMAWSMAVYEKYVTAHDIFNIVFEEKDKEKFPKVSSFRKELIESIINEINAIIPKDKLKLFRLFDPNCVADL